jgi:hypothetical protein
MGRVVTLGTGGADETAEDEEGGDQDMMHGTKVEASGTRSSFFFASGSEFFSEFVVGMSVSDSQPGASPAVLRGRFSSSSKSLPLAGGKSGLRGSLL